MGFAHAAVPLGHRAAVRHVVVEHGKQREDWHRLFGLMFLTLVPFRLIWGFIGGSTARFSFTGADRHVDTMEGALSPAGPIALIGAVAVAGGMARWVSEGLGL